MKRIFILLLLIGCSTTIPDETISGRYQNDNMILFLLQDGANVSATLEWSGFTTELTGKYDKVNRQMIMSGNYFGNQNISFNLFYGGQNLSGGYNYNGQGTQAINFRWAGKLKKTHDQGAAGGVY